jgi:hypothetical protein
MITSEVIKLSPLDRFIYWVRERHQIYLKRRAGKPKPWTDDAVLRLTFFTNPYRENDKVTAWFREHVREPMRDDPAVLFATVCFRWFNWIPTGELLLEHDLLTNWRLGYAKQHLRKLDRVFTGAFNISNSGSTKPKIDRVCDDYIQPVWDDLPSLLADAAKWRTMQQAHSRLKQYLGLGGSGFMAYEVVCDLRYTTLLEHATDKLTWSNPGPGAKRGLNRLLGRGLNEPVSRDLWQEESQRLLRVLTKQLPKMPPFEAREVEHSLCEYDKMERALSRDGHLKRKYNGA